MQDMLFGRAFLYSRSLRLRMSLFVLGPERRLAAWAYVPAMCLDNYRLIRTYRYLDGLLLAERFSRSNVVHESSRREGHRHTHRILESLVGPKIGRPSSSTRSRGFDISVINVAPPFR